MCKYPFSIPDILQSWSLFGSSFFSVRRIVEVSPPEEYIMVRPFFILLPSALHTFLCRIFLAPTNSNIVIALETEDSLQVSHKF